MILLYCSDISEVENRSKVTHGVERSMRCMLRRTTIRGSQNLQHRRIMTLSEMAKAGKHGDFYGGETRPVKRAKEKEKHREGE